MNADIFVDTNVLVYDQDPSDAEKHEAARRWMRHLWQTRRARLSAQVLSEYYVTVTRKLKPGRPCELAREDVRDLQAWRPVPIDTSVLVLAWDLEDRYSLSWWDALVAAAANHAGCEFLLTEDLQDGQIVDAVRVVNPFAHGAEDVG